MELDPSIKRIFPKNYALLLQWVEEGKFAKALHLCQERLLFSDDPYLRLIMCLIYRGMGFSTLFDMELSQLSDKLKDISEICENLKTEKVSEELSQFEPAEYQLPSMEPVSLKEEPFVEPPGAALMPSEEIQETGGEILKDLATPSLAELYVEQGAIQEAINIYETYLRANPHDEEAIKRLTELRKPDQRERLINILEDWLVSLRASFSTR